MGIVLFLQIDDFRTDITDGAALISHVLHGHVADHREMASGILHNMIVTVHQTRHSRQIIRKHGADFVEIDTVQADGDILKICGVIIVRIDLHNRAVISHKVDVGSYLLVGTEEDKIVFVQVELLVAQGRPFRNQTHTNATVHHLGLCTQAEPHLVGRIVIAHAKGCSTLLQHTVKQGIEDKLRILLVVTHLTAKRKASVALGKSHVDSIQAHIVVCQRVDIAATVHTSDRRRREVEQQLFEVDTLTL